VISNIPKTARYPSTQQSAPPSHKPYLIGAARGILCLPIPILLLFFSLLLPGNVYIKYPFHAYALYFIPLPMLIMPMLFTHLISSTSSSTSHFPPLNLNKKRHRKKTKENTHARCTMHDARSGAIRKKKLFCNFGDHLLSLSPDLHAIFGRD
jgi:hypothetical protein